MKTIFNKIYNDNAWGAGSGEGSLPKYTKAYRRFLEQFLRDKQISSVLDYGCGDWQFSQLIDWKNIQYFGVDVVDSLIERHTRMYGTKHIAFQVLHESQEHLPYAELIILKDVLQHWSHQSIQSFMPKIANFKFIMITNCVNPTGPTANDDISDGNFRYLDLRRPPFSYEMTKVLEFTNSSEVPSVSENLRWKKIVLLQEKIDDHV